MLSLYHPHSVLPSASLPLSCSVLTYLVRCWPLTGSGGTAHVFLLAGQASVLAQHALWRVCDSARAVPAGRSQHKMAC